MLIKILCFSNVISVLLDFREIKMLHDADGFYEIWLIAIEIVPVFERRGVKHLIICFILRQIYNIYN